MHTDWLPLTWKVWQQINFSDFVTTCLNVGLESKSLSSFSYKELRLNSAPADQPGRVVQIIFALYLSVWFLSLWMNSYWLCRPPVCEAEMTYDRVSISFLHLQPQLISSHTVDLLEIKQPWPWLCVWSGKGGGRWQNKILATCFDDTHPGTFLHMPVCRMALHVSLSQFICLLSYQPHERPRQPPIRRRMIIVGAFPARCR